MEERGSWVSRLLYFLPEKWQGERVKEKLTPLRNMLLWSLNWQGRNTDDVKSGKIDVLFVWKKFEALALSDTM